MKASRRTMFRTAAIAAGTVTAVALPMGAAFADSPAAPGSHPTNSVVQPENPDRPETTPDTKPESRPEDKPETTPDIKPGPETKPETKPDAEREQDKPQDQVESKTVSLKDGGVAKINWILGKPRAELFSRFDKAIGTLERPGSAKTLDSGLRVTLLHGGDLKQVWTDTKPGGEGGRHDYQERTVKLRDGGKAIVSKAKNGVFGAQLWDKHGNVGQALEANAKPTATLRSGLKVTLTKSGKIVQEWTKSSKPNPKPKPGKDESKEWTVKLKDGNSALVGKGTDGVYGAKIWDENGAALDGVHAKIRPSVTLPSGLKVTVTKDGKILQAWTGKTAKPEEGRHTTMPKGGVKAGADGVESGGNTLLLAGGGAAAAGAAGLGFTMLRRRKADDNT
ncbi:hypothetical protein [Streptomyces sp. cg36]|uniref:hypothetical protein n=1 Tax=Streptomyces sp. cg36 TaxID=3238798 RepID=UPI0034E2A8C5